MKKIDICKALFAIHARIDENKQIEMAIELRDQLGDEHESIKRFLDTFINCTPSARDNNMVGYFAAGYSAACGFTPADYRK